MKMVAIVVIVFIPLIILTHKKATASQKQDTPPRTDQIPPPQTAAVADPNEGEALETPNQRRRRLAAEAAPAPPLPVQYQFTEALDALRDADPKAPTHPLSHSQVTKSSAKKAAAAKDTHPKPEVAVSATASAAVTVSDRWQKTEDLPAEGKDGRVVYSEGGGLPTVVCAPLRLCIVELQTGEKLTGEPQIGDSVRWSVEPASYGLGEATTPLIVIKPKAVGLDTNLVVTTDRRSYYLRLMSNAQNYVARVSFDYPDDERAEWAIALHKQAQAVKEAQFDKGVKTLADSVEALNVDYRIKGDKGIRPLRVVDDGVHTYIQMNPAVLHREVPVLAVIGPDGKAEMVNYRVKGSVYIVDRLFDRGRLILGSGRSARKADIISGSVKERRLFARDPYRDLANDKKTEDESQ